MFEFVEPYSNISQQTSEIWAFGEEESIIHNDPSKGRKLAVRSRVLEA